MALRLNVFSSSRGQTARGRTAADEAICLDFWLSKWTGVGRSTRDRRMPKQAVYSSLAPSLICAIALTLALTGCETDRSRPASSGPRRPGGGSDAGSSRDAANTADTGQ